MKGNDNQDLTRVGSGTVMGEFMRQYWLPAIRSSELKADAPPMRLMLLGEKLLAFRVSSGRAAVLDHRCPHRCASLFFGRNEHDGLRCIYHGWKFDADGKCVEMPNVAPQYDYKDKVTAKAYRTAERNGVIWVYMGSEAEAPPLPMIEATLVPEAELTIDFKQLECNFLQSLEGEIDTSHLGFLHLGNIEADQMGENDPTRFALADRTPEIKVSDAPWGTTYCGHRAAKGAGTYWRFANFLFPFWTQSPQGPFANTVRARAWVPMDDTHTMAIGFTWSKGGAAWMPMKDGSPLPGLVPMDFLPNTTDWYGRYRLAHNRSNDYFIDRDAQRSNALYSGIGAIDAQDQVVTESMGPISDHSWEHLGVSDLMIARTRRRLLSAAREWNEHRKTPPALKDPEVQFSARGGEFVTPEFDDWQRIYGKTAANAVRAVAYPGGNP